MALSIGIVGLPNVGKSTLFTALTSQGGLATDYPFASAEPNVGVIPVPDERLQALADIVHPGRIVAAAVEFVDIAGLAKGANAGGGLGNKFLVSIRESDALIHVVRYFDSGNVPHPEGSVDPERDREILNTELILADIGTLEKAMPRLEKDARRDKANVAKHEIAHRMLAWLSEGNRAADYAFASPEEKALLADLHLISMKKMLYVANISEDEITDTALHPVTLAGEPIIPISAKIEADIVELAAEDPEAAAEFMESMGLVEGGLVRLVREAYQLLGLQSFFTAGEMEVKAWTIPLGTKAPQAAGVIHTDFEKGFIKAETASFADYVEHGGEAGLRTAGKLRLEGKDYVVQDGDVMHFRFNKTK
ncbi:MAG: redox-regulated ATPase YchF [Coriobacteriales bacterium]|nr:redox-regulated ATPase YchF [Coriobacteriales bacterium]